MVRVRTVLVFCVLSFVIGIGAALIYDRVPEGSIGNAFARAQSDLDASRESLRFALGSIDRARSDSQRARGAILASQEALGGGGDLVGRIRAVARLLNQISGDVDRIYRSLTDVAERSGGPDQERTATQGP